MKRGAPPTGDTIVAIATPPGAGAIGVIRISGPAAGAIAGRVVLLSKGHSLETARPRTLHRATLIDPVTGEELDVVLVAKMPGPHSYTGEDVVEISCHGNPVLLRETVRLLLIEGGRLAEPGEFTKRAYLNGQLDLLQAEAVAALIGARTARAVRLAARQLRGPLAEEISTIRERLVDLVAELEVTLDFPEEDVGVSRAAAIKLAEGLAVRLDGILDQARRGQILQKGLVVMLAGAPNVGKSSLLNAIVGSERAIISPYPGTTRDLVEDSVEIRGIPVRLRDGAGLSIPHDPVEAEGMRRARRGILDSDLVVVVLDRSRPRSTDDMSILELTSDRLRVVVGNKSDLPSAWTGEETCDLVCSALTTSGIDGLVKRLEEWVSEQTGEAAEAGGVSVSVRVLAQLGVASSALGRARDGLESIPIEAVLVDLREAINALGQTMGVGADEDILGRIFARFCVGK